jgi:SAM-dependent methyltransferase
MTACPACGASGLEPFHAAEGVPTNSCLLLEDETEARTFPRGRLDLAFCGTCGFITNRAFDPALAEYSGRYEETQSFSQRFVDFGRDLAKTWVERYDLHGRHVLEIGCGKGEFLTWMVEAGAGSGTGIDPGVHPERIGSEAASRIEWIADFYDASRSDLVADAVVCRHTLEHIAPVHEFLSMVRRNIGDRTDTIVLFELPDVARVLEEVAFWDTYYEHCSYFSAGSLARLFRRCGFEVLDLSLAYDDQYLLLEARPATRGGGGVPSQLEGDLDRLRAGVATFRDGYSATVARWQREFASLEASGRSAVIWGGGSKGVAFLTSVGVGDRIAGAVDINPHKQGRYIAGSGHEVLAPADLVAMDPALVVAMNPVYLDEIREDLDALGLQDARLVAV